MRTGKDSTGSAIAVASTLGAHDQSIAVVYTQALRNAGLEGHVLQVVRCVNGSHAVDQIVEAADISKVVVDNGRLGSRLSGGHGGEEEGGECGAAERGHAAHIVDHPFTRC